MSTASSATPTTSVDLQPGRPPTLTAEAGGDAPRWAADHRDDLRDVVAQHGSVLVRGLGLSDATEIETVFRTLADELMIEREAFDPRRVYAHGVYAASKWAPNQQMCSHHELSYACEVPSLMMFACLTEPTDGGATGIADGPTVLEALSSELTERFEREGWLLVRNYNDEIGASVAESFGTDDRSAVEAYCRANAIEFEWQPDGGLRTRQRRSAIVHHPVTGRRCWFNSIAFLNEWTLDPDVRDYLVEIYGPDGLPFNTRFGNGDPLDAGVVDAINDVYEAHIVREPLRAGDLMLIDNIRTAHSREPFEGAREVLAAMGDPVRIADCSPTIAVGCSP